MSRIIEMLEAIHEGKKIIEVPQSRIEAILIAISNGTPYTALPESRMEELFLDLYEGRPTSIIPSSEVEGILVAAIRGEAYTGEKTSELSSLLAVVAPEIGGGTPPAPTLAYDSDKLMSMAIKDFYDDYNLTSTGFYALSNDEGIRSIFFPKVTTATSGFATYDSGLEYICCPVATGSSSALIGSTNIKEILLPSCTTNLSNIISNTMTNIETLMIKTQGWNLLTTFLEKIKNLIILRTSAPTVTSGYFTFPSNSPMAQGTGRIYVPESALSKYKTAEGFVNYKNQIYAWEGSILKTQYEAAVASKEAWLAHVEGGGF